jgi:predicted helicase
LHLVGLPQLSRHLINEYRGELDRLKTVSGSRRESVLREAFKDLLKRWGRNLDLTFVPEHDLITPQQNRIYVDGALLHALRVPFGYWEAKDENDDLNQEIAAKRRKGYPTDNIIFEDTSTAVLIQDGSEVLRVSMDNSNALGQLLSKFFAHERAEIADFNMAVRQFALDLPKVLEALRDIIANKRTSSAPFATAENIFLQHARNAINPSIKIDDVQEMLIQHILTEDIFAKVFDNPDFHRQNNIASELYKLENALFGRGAKSQLLRALAPYYAGIASTAALIQSHSEKQGFLKALYENFYKVYNPKAAERLGVIYTPGEIVRFMIRSTDWLCEKHFDKNLVDQGVDILDPATGTGTFVVEMLEHFRGHKEKLYDKYKSEIHANEIGVLPYYVANLNIEATYQAITGQFVEFENLCLVDTLDNVAALGIYAGHQFDLLGTFSDENVERIKRQNRRKISVIIGNPPYNAWQESFNGNNANRPYNRVDERVKQTYVKLGTAQNQSSVYDMYTRFVRWASDRLGDDGIIAFVIGRKPISKGAYDGFRQTILQEFDDIWLMDLGGDVRENPRLSGNVHNVFGIQTGVMIAFLVRRKGKSRTASIRYARRPEMETAEDKLAFLGATGSLSDLSTQIIKPNKKHDWLDQPMNEWDELLPLVDPAARNAEDRRKTRAIFEMASSGVQTKQDEWAYANEAEVLATKMQYLIASYQRAVEAEDRAVASDIKWHRELDRRRIAKQTIEFDPKKIRPALYRPFTKRFLYFDRLTNSQSFRMHEIFQDEPNETIAFLGIASANPLSVLATDCVFDTCLLKNGNGSTQSVPRYRYTKSGERVDNVTDWAVNQFTKKYGKRAKINKDSVFHYIYAILHDPVYKESYSRNLKREFPRIPLMLDFSRWEKWGEELLQMHMHYETVDAWAIEQIDSPTKRAKDTNPRLVLRSDPAQGSIIIDTDTRLSGIPTDAWEYRLGNRPAIDWVLDQHKERRLRDATLSTKFEAYRFAGYKTEVIATLSKVVTVAMRTVAIRQKMMEVERSAATTTN